MSTFDWSKVTAEQLRGVPRAVVGDRFEIARHPYYTGVLLCGDILMAGVLPSGWYVKAMRYATAREVLACIDRIENYLRMCY